MSEEYYDRYVPERRWDRVLFLPGRGLQSAELNELQSIFNQKLKKFGDLFMNDGVPISGCIITPPTEYPGTVYVSKGSVYINGQILFVPGKNVIGEFSGEGTEFVYIDFESIIMTDEDDPELLDQISGEPGAHRRILGVKFYNEENKKPTSIKFDRLDNGAVLFKRSSFGLDKVREAVEIMTYEENGNFLVEGADITIKENVLDDSKYDIIVGEFIGYFRGKRYSSNVSQMMTLDKCNETYGVEDLFPISTGTGSTNNIFELSYEYADQISQISYPKYFIDSIDHLQHNGIDELHITGSLAQILKVIKGAKEYVEGIDFRIKYSARSLDWALNGDEPGIGETYTVELVCYETQTIYPGQIPDPLYVEFQYINSGEDDYSESKIIINDTSYHSENKNFVVNIEYSVFKHRIDGISLDEKTGLIKVTKGRYSKDFPIPKPTFGDSDVVLATIRLTPGDYSNPYGYIITDRRVFAILQEEIQIMRNSLSDTQLALASAQLDQDASDMPISGVMKGTYIDDLSKLDKSDMTYDGNISYFPEPYECGFDNDFLSLPLETNDLVKDLNPLMPFIKMDKTQFLALKADILFKYLSLKIIEDDGFILSIIDTRTDTILETYSGADPSEIKDKINNPPTASKLIKVEVAIDEEVSFVAGEYSFSGNISSLRRGSFSWTLPFEEKIFDEQLWSTTFISVIPFDIPYGMQTIEVDPSSDIFVDDKNMTVIKRGKTLKRTIRKVQSIGWIHPPGGFFVRRATIIKRDFTVREKVTPLGIATSFDVVKYARQRPIIVSGKYWFVPGEASAYNLKCTVSGVVVSGFSDNIKLQSDGSFFGMFTIPPGVPNGTIPIRIFSDPEYIEAETNYYAEGTMVTNTRMERRIRTVTETERKSIGWMVTARPWRSTLNRWGGGTYFWGKDASGKLRMQRTGSRASFFKGSFFRDPIAQSFYTEREQFLTSVEIFFQQKDENIPVSIHLCELETGYPTDTYFATATLEPSQVNISNDSSVGTKFIFPDPVYVKKDGQYAFIAKSDSAKYVVFIAEQGKTDYLTGGTIVSNPGKGVFFRSQNASTWSAEQEKAIKYKLYRAEFSSSGEVLMTKQTINDSWLMLLSDLVEYSATSCRIYYKIGTDWTPIKIGEKKKLVDKGLISACQVKFKLTTSNSFLSPVLEKNSLGSLYWHYDKEGYWYSDNLDFGDDNKFNYAYIRVGCITNGIPVTLKIIASTDQKNWYLYSLEPIRSTLIDEETGAVTNEYEVNMFDNFSGFNLARYLKVQIKLGYEDYDGSNTPFLGDLRIVVNQL